MIKIANSNLQNKTSNASCPDCASELYVAADTVIGEILSCPSCGLELEVKEIDGGECLSLQELTLEGEDWGE